MSGHSKWHNIQKTKGAADAKRSAAFTKIARRSLLLSRKAAAPATLPITPVWLP